MILWTSEKKQRASKNDFCTSGRRRLQLSRQGDHMQRSGRQFWCRQRCLRPANLQRRRDALGKACVQWLGNLRSLAQTAAQRTCNFDTTAVAYMKIPVMMYIRRLDNTAYPCAASREWQSGKHVRTCGSDIYGSNTRCPRPNKNVDRQWVWQWPEWQAWSPRQQGCLARQHLGFVGPRTQSVCKHQKLVKFKGNVYIHNIHVKKANREAKSKSIAPCMQVVRGPSTYICTNHKLAQRYYLVHYILMAPCQHLDPNDHRLG